MKILPSIHSFKLLLMTSLLFSVVVSSFAYAQSSAVESHSDEVVEPISQAELEQILAPIALYPDTILSHILVASTYPLEVVQAERWAERNSELEGQDAVEAVAEFDWDPSVQALVAFPQVLKRLSQDLDWTQKLGDAFLDDEEQVLASVQNLRELAEEAGSLDEMEKVTVSRDDSSIIIEPREREVVYVPYYDTRVVYGPWRWRHYQPVYWGYPYAGSFYYDDYYAHHPHRSFFWGPRISLSFGFFFNTFHWSNRHLVRISSRHYRPNRYYGYHDIIDHRYARRWVHDRNRRYGNRNRHVSRHTRASGGIDNASSGNYQVRHNQLNRPSSPQRVREGLVRQRNNAVRTNRARTNRVQRTVNQSRTANRGARNSNVIEDSRVALPNRSRAVNNSRRAANRPASSRPITRPATRPVSRPATRPVAATRPQSRPAASRPAARPPARQQQRVSRPAPPPRAVVAERKPPAPARTSSRRDRRQPR